MFKKLNLQHDLTFSPGLDLLYRFGLDQGQGWQGISYYTIQPDIKVKLLNILPAECRSRFDASLMIINRTEIPAHVDNGILTSINFYIETADAVTRFHRFKTGVAPALLKLPNQDDGAIFEADCLELDGEFKAEKNDVWLLDVKKPHSVSCSSTVNRIAYCLQSRTVGYDQLLTFLGL
jgi:hypothetical protein